jgi:hypothetical protein
MGNALKNWNPIRSAAPQQTGGDATTGDATTPQQAAPGGYLDWLVNSGRGDTNRFPPADTSRPQTWTDWATRTYSPGAGDFGKVFGDAFTDHLYGVGARAAEGAGVDTGDYGTQALEQSRRDLGPMTAPVSALGYALSPINKVPGLNVGLAPAAERIGAAVIPAAERYLPKFLASRAPAAVSGATQNAAISASNTASRGGSPSDVLMSAAEALPVGALFGGAFSGASVKPQTMEDIVGKTAQAKQAANEQLTSLRYPAKEVGYEVGGKQQPTLADLIDQRDWALEQGKASPLMRLRTASPTAETVAGSTTPNQAGWSPEKGWSSPPPDYGVVTQGKADPGKVLQGIAQNTQRTIDQGTPIGGTPGQGGLLEGAAQMAARRNEQAQMLERWNAMADVPGFDVQGAAQKAMMEQPVGSPEFNALKGVASVPKTPPPPGWLGHAQAAANFLGTAAGEGGAALFGLPHGGAGTVGNVVGQGLSYGLGKFATPKDVSPLIQLQIARAAQPMTGYAVRPGGDPNALGSALMYLYQNTPPMF